MRIGVPVLVQDNDDAGVILTESYGVSDLDEDGHPTGIACYWVTLKSVPTAPVKVEPKPDSQVRVQPSELNLNASNWNALGAESNKICIYPEQDPQIEGTPNQFCADKKVDLFGTGGVDKQVCGSHLGAVDHAISSSDGKYDDGTATVPVTNNAKDFGTGPRVIDVLIRDDDQPGVRLGVRSLNALEGQPASYGTRLLSQPNADVTLNVSTGTVCCGKCRRHATDLHAGRLGRGADRDPRPGRRRRGQWIAHPHRAPQPEQQRQPLQRSGRREHDRQHRGRRQPRRDPAGQRGQRGRGRLQRRLRAAPDQPPVGPGDGGCQRRRPGRRRTGAA